MSIGHDIALPHERVPHPAVFAILYIPFGALSGFVTVALTFMGSASGLSVSDTSLLGAANLLTSWLKWTWAPMVDVTLSPKRWYVFATMASALGVFAMAAVPLSQATLPLVCTIIALASLINSVVGMSIEAIMAITTTPEEQGRVSGWFQVGNLGGGALGGFIGLLLLTHLPAAWMAGAVMAGAFMACCAALQFVPDVRGHRSESGVAGATWQVCVEVWAMLKTRPGFLSALLCLLPIGTGAAQGVLAQEDIAAYWGAGADEVAFTQGLAALPVIMLGCFTCGWLCKRFHPRTVYAAVGLGLAAVAIGMALTPVTGTIAIPGGAVFGMPTVGVGQVSYLVWSLTYQFGVGVAYAGFTAVVLSAIGDGSAATKYSFFASLSNFPIWWLGLLLGRVADVHLGLGTPATATDGVVAANGFDVWLAGVLPTLHLPPGATTMLFTEAILGVLGVALFALVVQALGKQSPAPQAPGG